MKKGCDASMTNNVDNDPALPHAQFHKLGKFMCDHCSPIFQQSSASLSGGSLPTAQQQRLDSLSQWGSITTPAGEIARDIYEDIVARVEFDLGQDVANSNNGNTNGLGIDLAKPGAETSLFRSTGAQSRFVFPMNSISLTQFSNNNDIISRSGLVALPPSFATPNLGLPSPTLRDFLDLATSHGWTAANPKGSNLTVKTKSAITEDFLGQIDRYLSPQMSTAAHGLFSKPSNPIFGPPDVASVKEKQKGRGKGKEKDMDQGNAFIKAIEGFESVLADTISGGSGSAGARLDSLGTTTTTTSDKGSRAGSGAGTAAQKEKETPTYDDPNKVVKNTNRKSPAKTKGKGKAKTTTPKKADDGDDNASSTVTPSPRKTTTTSPKKTTASPKKSAIKASPKKATALPKKATTTASPRKTRASPKKASAKTK